MSPTARTLAHLRKLGYTAEKVEQRLPIPGKYVTRDFLECIDILAMRPDEPVLGVQCTSHSNLSNREKKCIEKGHLWLSTGSRLEAWAWRPIKGKRAWQLDRRIIPRIDGGA